MPKVSRRLQPERDDQSQLCERLGPGEATLPSLAAKCLHWAFSDCTGPPHHTRQRLQVRVTPPIQTGIPVWDAKGMILAAALTAELHNAISLLTPVNESVLCFRGGGLQ